MDRNLRRVTKVVAVVRGHIGRVQGELNLVVGAADSKRIPPGVETNARIAFREVGVLLSLRDPLSRMEESLQAAHRAISAA